MTLDDVAPAIWLGEEMHEHSVMAAWPLDREKAAFMLHRYIPMPEVFTWGAFEKGECVAAFLGVAEPHMFIDVIVAKDLVFYGRRDGAGAKGAVALLAAFESWSREMGAGVVFIEVSAGITDERTVRLLKRLGYEETGTGMRKAA